MLISDLQRLALEFVEQAAENRLGAEQALRPDLVGLRIFGPPLLGAAAASDGLFEELRRPGVIGPGFMPPLAWMPGAATVLSFFLPYTPLLIKSNLGADWPSTEWLHGRWEGQICVAALSRSLAGALAAAGEEAVVPSLSPLFRYVEGKPAESSDGAQALTPFSSNWSERHVAHVCGLGAFGLSAGLITRAGMAGRFGSLVTSLSLPPTPRAYASYNAWCTRCGVCARRCPVGAITLEQGKNHSLCAAFLDKTRAAHHPRYGCGKCQSGVPCSSRRPDKSARRTLGASS